MYIYIDIYILVQNNKTQHIATRNNRIYHKITYNSTKQ